MHCADIFWCLITVWSTTSRAGHFWVVHQYQLIILLEEIFINVYIVETTFYPIGSNDLCCDCFFYFLTAVKLFCVLGFNLIKFELYSHLYNIVLEFIGFRIQLFFVWCYAITILQGRFSYYAWLVIVKIEEKYQSGKMQII